MPSGPPPRKPGAPSYSFPSASATGASSEPATAAALCENPAPVLPPVQASPPTRAPRAHYAREFEVYSRARSDGRAPAKRARCNHCGGDWAYNETRLKTHIVDEAKGCPSVPPEVRRRVREESADGRTGLISSGSGSGGGGGGGGGRGVGGSGVGGSGVGGTTRGGPGGGEGGGGGGSGSSAGIGGTVDTARRRGDGCASGGGSGGVEFGTGMMREEGRPTFRGRLSGIKRDISGISTSASFAQSPSPLIDTRKLGQAPSLRHHHQSHEQFGGYRENPRQRQGPRPGPSNNSSQFQITTAPADPRPALAPLGLPREKGPSSVEASAAGSGTGVLGGGGNVGSGNSGIPHRAGPASNRMGIALPLAPSRLGSGSASLTPSKPGSQVPRPAVTPNVVPVVAQGEFSPVRIVIDVQFSRCDGQRALWIAAEVLKQFGEHVTRLVLVPVPEDRVFNVLINGIERWTRNVSGSGLPDYFAIESILYTHISNVSSPKHPITD